MSQAAPHEAQQKVIDGEKRFNVVCCGRRWGKTQLGMDRLVDAALKTGKPTAWFAPIYKDTLEVWREFEERLYPIIVDANKQERRLRLVSGAIEFWSLDDPDAGRGRKYAEIVIDEAAKVPELDRAWTLSIRPMLADYQGGAWFLSTPKGTANYFHTPIPVRKGPTEVRLGKLANADQHQPVHHAE